MVGTDDILIHNLDADVSPVNPETTEGFSFVQLALILLVVIIFGIGIGFGVAKLKGATKTA